MGIRETLNKNSKAVSGVMVALLACTLITFIYTQTVPTSVKPPRLKYFSDDDGKTFFEDDYLKVGPCQHDGKEAVVARVFRCPDGKLFIGYLERASGEQAKAFLEDAGRKLVATAATQPTAPADTDLIVRMQSVTQVKRPGSTKWIAATSSEASSIVTVTCPGGGVAALVMP